jgi:hypothetical protein
MKLLSLPFALALAASAMPAAILFQDDFNSSLGATTFNADIPNWTESNGSIDYLKSGDFAITCLGGSGGCLDMDGTTSDGGDLTSASFNLVAGLTYQVSYYFSGNQRGSAADSMTVSFGGVTNTHTAIASSAPFTQFFINVTPLANTTTQLVFSHAGGDNFGLVLDDVVVAEGVPEPSSAVLLGLGVTALALVRRRMARR